MDIKSIVGTKFDSKAMALKKKKQDTICQRLHAGAPPPRLSILSIGTLKSKVHRARSLSAGSLPHITPNPSNIDYSSHISLKLSEKTLYHATEQERDKAILMLRAPKVFWRYHLNAEIDVHYHPNNSLFEIMSYDIDSGTLLSRLYCKADDIYKANEKNFERNYREVTQELHIYNSCKFWIIYIIQLSRMRRDLLDKARLTSAVEFIMETIEVDSTSANSSRRSAGDANSALEGSDIGLKLCLRKFNGRRMNYTQYLLLILLVISDSLGECVDLTSWKPLYVDPVNPRYLAPKVSR